MSTKRILGITVFGILFITAVIGVMLLSSLLQRDSDAIALPETQSMSEQSNGTEPDTLNRIEVTSHTVQAVISKMSRPDTYSRDVVVETFWEDGQATHYININVASGLTSLRILPPTGVEKRIIISADTVYIWYRGDREPYIGMRVSLGDVNMTGDEWQMLVTYEDLLELNQSDIMWAEYTEFGGEDCIGVEYRSSRLQHMVRYYVSLELGLLTGAVEHDENGALIYKMTAGECLIGEVDMSAFTLPDGTELLD